MDSSSVHAELITDFGRLEELSDCWTDLWGSDPESEIFQTFTWARCWWKAYAGECSLFSVAVFRGSKCIGFLPLVERRRTLRFLGHIGADYNDIVCQPGAAKDVISAGIGCLLQHASTWRDCILDRVPEHSRFIHALPTLPGDIGKHLHITSAGRCPTIILPDNGKEREELFAGFLRKPYLKRHYNKLAKQGCVSFHHITDPQEAQFHLSGLFRQHILRRAMAGERSQFLNSATCAFYRLLAESMDLRSHLRFSVIELDKKPIAYHFGFQVNKKFLMYKPTFDIDSWELSPGDVLLRQLLQYAQQEDIREYDFTIGAESFKEHFANYKRQSYTIQIAHGTSRERFAQMARLLSLDAVRRQAGRFAMTASAMNYVRSLRNTLYSRRKPVSGNSGPRRLFVRPPHEPTIDHHIPSCKISDLAEAALRYHDLLNSDLLQAYRERIRKGQRFFLVENGGQLQIAWLSLSSRNSRIENDELAHDGCVALYDFHTFPKRICAPLNPVFIEMATCYSDQLGLPCYVSCPVRDHSTVTTLLELGFQSYSNVPKAIREYSNAGASASGADILGQTNEP